MKKRTTFMVMSIVGTAMSFGCIAAAEHSAGALHEWFLWHSVISGCGSGVGFIGWVVCLADLP